MINCTLKEININLFSAIIFDFDGVIVDSETAQIKAWKWALSKHKLSASEDKLIGTAGMRDEEIVKILLEEEYLQSYHEKVLKSKTWKTNIMYERGEIKLVTGVIDFIKSYCNSHVLAIATNSRSNRAETLCTSQGIIEYFKVIVTGKGNLRAKPHPDIYIKTIEELSLPSDKCIVIEDSIPGLQSAKAAGLAAVGIATIHDKSTLKKYSNWVIKSFEELL